MTEVLQKIAKIREEKIQKLGFNFNLPVPMERQVPLCPPHFELNSPLMIAEIKRASPSAGTIGKIPNPVSLAANYINNGAKVISVLTEEDHFNGSLHDLMEVKKAFKNTSILRKDFIQHPEEIKISYLAGADLVLLIAAMFIDNQESRAKFAEILQECTKYSLTPLIEIHNEKECEFVLPYNPTLLGINSRNLQTFEIDKNKALHLKAQIPNSIKTIFESGIQSSFDGYLAGTFGFDGMLCGSYLVRTEGKNQNLPNLIKSYIKAKKHQSSFYPKILHTIYNTPSILVKICGITDLDDAFCAADAGADMIGFILTKESPRYVNIKNVKLMSKAITKIYPHILKIGVITPNKDELIAAKELFKEGILDALQLHSINPEMPNNYASFDLNEADFDFYGCINFENIQDYPKNSISPFILLDSKSQLKGGSGKSIELQELSKLKDMGKQLFIAGGIGLENIDAILSLKPKMLDINSKIELTPGKKDRVKLKAIIQKIKTFSPKDGK